jgi:hypothetical protein
MFHFILCSVFCWLKILKVFWTYLPMTLNFAFTPLRAISEVEYLHVQKFWWNSERNISRTGLGLVVRVNLELVVENSV